MDTTKESTQVQKSKHSQVFTLVKGKDEKIFIAVGKYRISPKTFDTFKQAEMYIAFKPYELIINLIDLAIYENEQEKQSEKSTKCTKRTKKISNENKEQLDNNEN